MFGTIYARSLRHRAAIIAGSLAAAALVITGIVAVAPQAAVAGPTINTQTFSYTGSTATFTVPSGITSITVTATGGEGGQGGADANGPSPQGGYRGVVTGTLAVTPGQSIGVAVGSGGVTGPSNKSATSGTVAVGGSNPLTGYAGGSGGKAGSSGISGFGGGGGAATVVTVSSSTVVAGGGGGSGGSGQYASTLGRIPTSTYTGRTDTTSTSGQTGINASDACTATSCSNSDGGGSGGGGGGAQGGAQGQIQFGAGSSNEWFGYGGSVGQNSTASLSGLTASYQYYSDNNANGSVVITWETGSPAVPTGVAGTAGVASANLVWTAPTDVGQSAITDYFVQYSSNGGTSWSSPVDMGSTSTSGTITGLTNGTTYIFQVAAANSIGTGSWSASSNSITPQAAPSAPTNLALSPQDGALSLSFTAPSSGAAVTSYDYQVNGGSWVNVASSATTIVVPGLTNGTSYTVAVRAESAVGPGASASVSGTPLAVPGAPTITSAAASNGSISLAFTPGFSGGASISDYQYRLDGGSWVSAGTTSSPITITGISAGSSHTVALRASNVSGSGPSSTPVSVTAPSLPGAPTITSATPGDGTASIAVTPGTTGGSPLLYYQYQTVSNGPWTSLADTSSPILITGLTNGTQYNVTVRAVNAVGAGTASASTAVTPATVPGAPTIVGSTIAGSNLQLPADFTAPSNDGGSPITGYQYSTDGGATWIDRTDGGGVTTPVVIAALSSDGTTPLASGVTYYVELRAVNAVGVGTASAVATGIATTVPSAPTISTVTPSAGALSVVFTAGSNGGSAITGYKYSVDGGTTWVSTGTLGTTFTISGLTNGQSYPVQVEATNSQGDGVASSVVSGTPSTLPGGPTITGVVRSNQTLTASVSLADNGGSVLTSWQYSTDGGTTWATASGTSSPLTIQYLSSSSTTRLANGTGYALQVRAVNANGTGPASATTTVAPAAVPAAPSIALTPQNGAISVAFSFGVDGGSPANEVDYSLSGGTTWVNAGTLSSPFSIGSLTNGTSYAVQLRVDNAIGNGASSVPASTTPRTVPGSPTAVTPVSNTASTDVTWTAPASNGGATITGYTATAYATSSSTTAIATCTTSSTGCSITGLTNGTGYYVSVTATNVAGTGAASSPRVLVTPLVRPSAPTLTALAAGDGTLSVSFTAGAAGDRSISSYQYSTDGGATWSTASGSTTPILITGLTDGTAYTVVLRAVSAAGVGATSNTLTATPYTYPSAPDASTIVANGGNAQITVSWAAAALNGGTLLSYTATAFTALSSGSTAGTPCTTATLSCTITGLTNGTTYYVSLQTQNTASMYSVRSDPRVPATPSLTPGVPTGVTATAGNAQATVSWVAPVSTGASGISGYTIWCSASGGTYTSCGTASSVTPTTVTGLTNGTSYTFEVKAVNGSGSSALSSPSTAVSPIEPGTVPLWSTPIRTATGFVSSITNYDSTTSYALTATNGATATRTGSSVTVTGLSNGATSTLSVTATKLGDTDTTASVTGAALLTGITPTASTNAATTTGFSFTITNFDNLATYTVTASGSATATRSGSTVTVTGLSLGGSASVTVGVTRSGYTAASAVVNGAAMVAGTAPTFGSLASTNTGFTYTISNFDPSATYTFSATNGATVTHSGANVTVTGLTNGATSAVTVTATVPGVSVASAPESGAALLSGTAPTASTFVPTTDGFTFVISNLDGAATYSVAATVGQVSISNGLVTVTGLSAGQSSAVTVTDTKTGYTTTTSTITSSALQTGITPLFSSATPTATGYSFSITNFDNGGSYAATTTAGTVSVSGSLVTVSGLAASGSATVTVTASHTGYTDAAATQSGTALAVGTAPVLANAVPTADGFTFTISNYSSSLTYTTSVSPSSGVVVIASNGAATVSGQAPGAAVTVTVTATNPGVSVASATIGATVLLAGATPVLSTPVAGAGGYSFTITNYDPAVTYTFAATNGGSVVRNGSNVVVNGLGAAVFSQTVVTASRSGYTSASATAGTTSYPNGTGAQVTTVTRTTDGFTFPIDNFASGSTYTLTTGAGTATLTGSSVVVTGLAPGATTTVHIVVSLPGTLDESTDVAGTAISAGVAPILTGPTAQQGGFVVTISNYSSSFAYALSATAGGVATRNGATVTVSGLGSLGSSTLTVTTSQTGYQNAAGSVTGSALAVPSAPVVTTPVTVSTPAAPTVTSTTVPTVQRSTSTGASSGGGASGASAATTAASTPAASTSPASTSGAGTASASSSSSGSGSQAGSVTSDGHALPSQLAASSTALTVSSGAMTLRVAAVVDGRESPLPASQLVAVADNGELNIDVSGLASSTGMTVWSGSTSLVLLRSTTDGHGAASRRIVLHGALAAGTHVITVTGTNRAGHAVNMAVKIRVLSGARVTAYTSTASTGWWWLVLAAIIGAAIFLIAAWRRRRRESEDAAS